MKQYPTARLYDGLSNKARAVCVLEAIAREDRAELDRIHASVPRKAYTCLDAEFTDWRDKLISIAQLWDLLYWRALGGHLAARAAMNIMGDKAPADVITQIGRHAARVKALELALADVCDARGLPIEAIKRIADVAGDPISADLWPCDADETYREQVRSDFLVCLRQR